VRPRQEFVIGGWHPGAACRSGQLGSLQLGYYEHDSLHYAGKVGTGSKAHDCPASTGRSATSRPARAR
jgi:ATP-dependent DNA ligase